ncbi:hypothetical protein E2C01_013456 [Portunus trituberculatus]|uniref:Uncharacterized protein n=1 Tax=Portunus trituberculatus TaxID=210409 RepID=A0A5B7DH55_PORTR|nr:hypothetical protein [Portunus trituberculatus]
MKGTHTRSKSLPPPPPPPPRLLLLNPQRHAPALPHPRNPDHPLPRPSRNRRRLICDLVNNTSAAQCRRIKLTLAFFFADLSVVSSRRAGTRTPRSHVSCKQEGRGSSNTRDSLLALSEYQQQRHHHHHF